MEIIDDTAEMDEIKEARPIQIVTTENDHTFVLDEDTLSEILLQDHIKDRFVVVVSGNAVASDAGNHLCEI